MADTEQNVVVAADQQTTTATAAPAAIVQDENENNNSGAVVNAEMHANAIECANKSRFSPRREAADDHTTRAVRCLIGLNSAAKHNDVGNAHALLEALSEEDKKLFSEIPREFKPKGGQRVTENREMSVARKAEYHNENYSLPEKHIAATPRSIVDIRRPLTARYDPSSPQALRERAQAPNNSKYKGLSHGDLSSLTNDPIYTPSPDSRRQQIAAAKDKERSYMVKPHSPVALQRKKGPAPKEKTVAKKEADWFPANLYSLSEGKSNEGKQRRQEVQGRMSTHTFK